jgi:hypothetical protein
MFAVSLGATAVTAAAAAALAMVPGWRRLRVALRYALVAAGVATIGSMLNLLLGLGFV